MEMETKTAEVYERVDKMRYDWNMTCLAAGIPAITLNTCAQLMAVLYVHGNNENMVLHSVFIADLKYIQKRFGINGGGKPDPDFTVALKHYVKELEDYERDHAGERTGAGLFERHIPQWAINLYKNRYGIKLIN